MIQFPSIFSERRCESSLSRRGKAGGLVTDRGQGKRMLSRQCSIRSNTSQCEYLSSTTTDRPSLQGVKDSAGCLAPLPHQPSRVTVELPTPLRLSHPLPHESLYVWFPSDLPLILRTSSDLGASRLPIRPTTPQFSTVPGDNRPAGSPIPR
jgi:hypothetical protein